MTTLALSVGLSVGRADSFIYENGVFNPPGMTLPYGCCNATAINDYDHITTSFFGPPAIFDLKHDSFTPLPALTGFKPNTYGLIPYGINNADEVVGELVTDTISSFLYSNGQITGPYGGYPGLILTGINNHGAYIGNAQVFNNGPTEGIYWNNSNSGSQFILVPGSLGTYVTGLNDLGQVVGWFYAAASGYQGFLYDTTTHQYTIFSPPGGVADMQVTGINNSGEIIGWYRAASGQTLVEHGFVYQNGVFANFDVPGANYTEPQAINNNGTIVGTSYTSYGVPEPGTVGLGLAGFTFMVWRQRKRSTRQKQLRANC